MTPPKPTEIAEAIVKKARASGTKIVLAESCTGGALAYELTKVPGCSEVLIASVVTYTDQAKMELLYVDPYTLGKLGAVSSEVADLMVKGLQDQWSNEAQVFLSTTGFLQHEDPKQRHAFVAYRRETGGGAEVKFETNDRETNRAIVLYNALQRLHSLV